MTTPFPINNSVQIAEKSILDLFGRQVYLGNQFINTFTADLANTSETMALLYNNAITGTTAKGMFLCSRKVTSTAQVYVRYYLTPTVTSAGTPVTPINVRPAYGTSSCLTVTSSPTIAANGTLLSLQASLNASNSSELLFVIDPGYKLLVTVQALAGTPTVYVENCWYEL